MHSTDPSALEDLANDMPARDEREDGAAPRTRGEPILLSPRDLWSLLLARHVAMFHLLLSSERIALSEHFLQVRRSITTAHFSLQ